MAGQAIIVPPLLLTSPESSRPNQTNSVTDEWDDILRGEQARRMFAEGGEKMYAGYVLGRLAGSQNPELRQHASMPSKTSPESDDAPDDEPPDEPDDDDITPDDLPPPEPDTPHDVQVREALSALHQAQGSYVQIVARQRVSHLAALLEHSRANTPRQRLIRYVGYLMIPTDRSDLKRARANEEEANREAAAYNAALENYVQAVGGDRAQRDQTRLRMMDEFEASVQQHARQSMEPSQDQAQGTASSRSPSVPRPRPYRPSGIMRFWIESGPKRRTATVALAAGAGALALSGVLDATSAPWFVTLATGIVTPFAARSLGARFAVNANRHRFVYPPVAIAHEQQSQARNREYIQDAPSDEQQVDVTTAYRRGTQRYSEQALTEKRRAEKAAGIGAAIGFFAVQGIAGLAKVFSWRPGNPFAPSITLTPSHALQPTPNPAHTPVPTPTPPATPPTPTAGSVNYGAWPWDVAKQLGSPDPLQAVQNTIHHLNANGGHYNLIQQPSGREWVEQWATIHGKGQWVPLNPSQQLWFNHQMASLPIK